MDQQKQLIGVVIKADGTVPFDEGISPAAREHIIAFLVQKGHHVEMIDGVCRVRDWKKVP